MDKALEKFKGKGHRYIEGHTDNYKEEERAKQDADARLIFKGETWTVLKLWDGEKGFHFFKLVNLEDDMGKKWKLNSHFNTHYTPKKKN